MAEGEQTYKASGLDLPGGSTSADIKQQGELFEIQLQRMQTVDGKLDVWDRYIKWACRVFPQDGTGGQVSGLLERAVIDFTGTHKYNNEPRFVNLWIQLARRDKSPANMYSYMLEEKIGLASADLYLSWARYLQSQGDQQRALCLVQQGLSCNAQPAEQLRHYQRVLMQGQPTGSAPAAQAEEEAPEAPLSSSVSRRRRRRDLNTSASHTDTGHSSRSVSPGRTFQTCDVDSGRRATAPEPLGLPLPARPAKTGNTLTIPTSVPWLLPQASRAGSSDMEEQSEQLSVPSPFPACEDMQAESTDTQPTGSMEEAGLEERGGDNKRPMYCKEKLKGAAGVEFSFEELRAHIYFDRQKHQVEERLAQIEQEKQRLKEILVRRSQKEAAAGPAPLHPSQASRAESSVKEQQPTVPFTVYEDKQESVPFTVYEDKQESVPFTVYEDKKEPSVPFTVYEDKKEETVPFTVYEDMQTEPAYTQAAGCKQPSGGGTSQDLSVHEERRAQPPRSGAVNSEQTMNNKSFPERTESLSEEMTVYQSYQNKTMFSVPDNTCDFAAAAKMASTPCNRAASQRPPRTPNATASRGGLTEDLTENNRQPLCDKTPPPQPDSAPGAPQQRLQLSPIHETSREGWSSSASSAISGPASSLSSSTAPTATRLEESVDQARSTAVDPCSVDVRKCILDQSDITSSPHFHSSLAAMPHIQDGQITLGSQSFCVPLKLYGSVSTSVYTGCQTNHYDVVILKVDICPVPWDFYVASRLKDRQADDPQAPPLPDVSCFLFLDGCVTMYTLPPQHTLHHEEVHEEDDETDVAQLVSCVLRLTRSLHASHLLTGHTRAHMLFSVNCATQDVDCLLPVDLAASLDLLSQQEVTSARQLPHALPYITPGLIRPSDSPYQADLAMVAEDIYSLLTKKQLQKTDLIQDKRGWTVDGLDPYDIRSEMWAKMFRMLLNPAGQKTSVAVLSEILDLMACSETEI